MTLLPDRDDTGKMCDHIPNPVPPVVTQDDRGGGGPEYLSPCPLASIACNCLGEVVDRVVDDDLCEGDLENLQKENKKIKNFRFYSSTFTSRCKINGNVDVNNRNLTFQVGARNDGSGNNIKRNLSNQIRTALSVRVGPLHLSDFCAAAKRFSVLNADFSYMDHAATIKRLAHAICVYANTGTLNPKQLSDGQDARVIVLTGSGSGFTASNSHVFIPRCVDNPEHGNVFCALLYACTGAGATVITDALGIDANTGCALLPYCEDHSLVEGCYYALRILGSNYDAAGAGEIFALAMAVGVTDAVTVVAHTDEGGYMRKVLRSVNFGTPHGGLNLADTSYIGLPRPADFSVAHVQNLVDSMALGIAACVAYGDPLVHKDGGYFPTLFCVGDTTLLPSGLGDEPNVGNSYVLSCKIANGCGSFCGWYLKALAELFAINGESSDAQTTLIEAFNTQRRRADRHLYGPSVTPFFWIEPTGILWLKRHAYPSVMHGYTNLCAPLVKTVGPFFEKVEMVNKDNLRSFAYVDYRGARTSRLINHLNGHREDGLAFLKVRRCNPDDWCQTGGPNMSIRDRMVNNMDFATYLWTRGQSPICAPGESLFLGGTLGIEIKHFVQDPQSWCLDNTHFPSHDELVEGEVSYSVTRPSYCGLHALRYTLRSCRQARNLATQSLHYARSCGGIETENELMTLSFNNPIRRPRKESVQEGGTVRRQKEIPMAKVDETSVKEARSIAQARAVSDPPKEEVSATRLENVTMAQPLRPPTHFKPSPQAGNVTAKTVTEDVVKPEII